MNNFLDWKYGAIKAIVRKSINVIENHQKSMPVNTFSSVESDDILERLFMALVREYVAQLNGSKPDFSHIKVNGVSAAAFNDFYNSFSNNQHIWTALSDAFINIRFGLMTIKGFAIIQKCHPNLFTKVELTEVIENVGQMYDNESNRFCNSPRIPCHYI